MSATRHDGTSAPAHGVHGAVTATGRRIDAAALLLMLASGFAGLGCQTLWTRQGALWLGSDQAAVLAVITAFFTGLGLGSALGHRLLARGRDPRRLYLACEALIGGWSLLLIALLPPATTALQQAIGPEPGPLWMWALAFAGSTLLLLPATLAMGATLPTLDAVLAAGSGGTDRGGQVAGLYAANTAGATLGALLVPLWLLPAWGQQGSVLACAAANLGCALLAGWVLPAAARSVPALPHRNSTADEAPPVVAPPAPGSSPARRAKIRLAVTGLLGVGYEVVAQRVLSQVTEDTLYTFALLLAVYLVGTAAGAAAWARARRRALARAGAQNPTPHNATATPGLFPLASPPAHDTDPAAPALWRLVLATALSAPALWWAEPLHRALDGTLAPLATALGLGGTTTALLGEAGLALAAFGLPTLAMGALFSQLAEDARIEGVPLGQSLAFNTLGAALAPVLFGVALVPLLGAKGCWVLLPTGWCLLAAWPQVSRGMQSTSRSIASPTQIHTHTRTPTRIRSALAAAGLLAVAVTAPPLVAVDQAPADRRLALLEGPSATVSVVEDERGVARLRINNRQQEGSNATATVDGRQGLIPLLLHPAPRHALFLGVGTGITSGTAAATGLAVDAVDLLPEVLTSTAWFDPALPGGQAPATRRLVAADARRYVRTAGRDWDLIVADNFHPARSGSALLYTVEHFTQVRQHLAPGGLFCQWLPLHQLDLPTLRVITASFLQVWPDAQAILASHSLQTPVIGLVGGAGPAADQWVPETRLQALAARLPLAAYGLDDPHEAPGSRIADSAALHRWADGAPLNTDDQPRVAWMAPPITYAPDLAPAERLMAWLDALGPGADDSDATASGLAAWRRARTAFLRAGLHVHPSPDPQAMLAQVGPPLLAALDLSPDFEPAARPLLALGQALAHDQPQAARTLLQALQARRPQDARVAQALAALPPVR